MRMFKRILKTLLAVLLALVLTLCLMPFSVAYASGHDYASSAGGVAPLIVLS